MNTILITGATGNVGMAVIESLQTLQTKLNIVAGVRDVANDTEKLAGYNVGVVKFDFEDKSTYSTALTNCEILFLLRPPQIANTKKYFLPLIEAAQNANVMHIVFLSVQGVEKSSIIPHHQIEKMIVQSRIAYTFLRPAYFMQNFLTTLHDDLVLRRRIFLPAGNAKFTLVDVRDIGAVAANILTNPEEHSNKSYELTSNKKWTFAEMAQTFSTILGYKIDYISPNLIRFFLTKRKEKMPTMLILVMIMLHYFSRFQAPAFITYNVFRIAKKQPFTFEQFIKDNKKAFESKGVVLSKNLKESFKYFQLINTYNYEQSNSLN